MTGRLAGRYAEFVAARSKVVILAVLLLTMLVAAGAAVNETDDTDLGGFQVDSEETEAADYVQANYGQDDRIISQLVVRETGGDVLTRESLLEGLRLQRQVRANGTLNETLADQGFVGIENVVATMAVMQQSGGGPPANGQPPGGEPPTDDGSTTDGQPVQPPSLDEQIAALENSSEQEVEAILGRVLDPDQSARTALVPGDQDPYDFLPTSYEPGETEADARLTLVLQADETDDDEAPVAAYTAQVEIGTMVDERFDDAFLFGQGINEDASSRATGDSFAIITPVALVLVLFVLGIAYRDVLDILLALFGIVVVMLWLSGIMAWLQIPMNVILIAVPFLLIGLSIDYALHVVMRYREAREGTLDDGGESTDSSSATPDIRRAMTLGLGSVVLALAAATFSTGVGFLSNVVSPLPAIRDFAILSAGGILATFVVFAILLPAIKIEVDGLVENRLGRSRRKPAFGVESGLVNAGLSKLASFTARAPVGVLVVAFLLASGGALGATTIDTEFNQADFLPEDPPGWTENLPGSLAPDDYTIKDDFTYLSQNFQAQGQSGRSEILIRGEVTDGALLPAIDNASQTVDADSAVQRQPDGSGAIDGPHTVIREVASENETVAAAVDERDTDGDGLPDTDLAGFYDVLFDADEQAASEVLSRNEAGEVTSVRLLLSVKSDESSQEIARDTGNVADAIEAEAAGVTATPTGATVVEAVTQDALLETLVQAFLVTLVVILLFLTALFWVQYGAPTYGLVLLAPVVAALCWLLGAMALLDLPFNSETGVITSLAIGLGVDYSIHAGERFITERERRDSLEATLQATITGTGGALLASAGTTAAGFGVLALSLSPPLQRFGIVTGSAIVLAFIACVTVLPCLLVVRERLQDRFRA